MAIAVSDQPPAGAADRAGIERLFERQRETALRLRTSTAAERIAKLQRLKAVVERNVASLYEAGYQDYRKPPVEMDLTEVLPVVAAVNEVCRNLKMWMKPNRVGSTILMAGTSAWIQHEPRGRCLILSPWNYPVNLTFGPLVYAIAAGNTAILKPSEMTPHISAWLTRVTREVLSEDEVAVCEGDAAVSSALLALPFDHIFFTGSPAIGKVVMTAAAKHLTSVTLELGGKSPSIVDESADVDLAARTLLWGKFTNNGQTCIAPDHVYVHESVKARFVAKCLDVLKSAYGGTADEQMGSTSLARIVNRRHTERVNGLLQDARSRGATVLYGGDVREPECFVAPTLLTDIPPGAKIMDEEIFGPLLPVIGYRDISEVIGRINDAPKPLALYVWSSTEATIQRILKETSAGGTCINHAVVHFLHANLPFGGVNNSGIGSSHGIFGFRAFSHERAVLRARLNIAQLLFPPYKRATEAVARLMIKLS
ncbi:MAG: aldehyde dehydrogenase family protein [Gemmatimonadota bacterium]